VERPHSHRLRAGRHSECGRYYLLTTCTYERKPYFSELSLARLAITELIFCDRDGLSNTCCYVVMPDHIHWLVELKIGSLSALMRRFKARTSLAIRKHHGVTPLWQNGFHDRAVREGEYLRLLARYVVANPLRKKLAANLADYPHWDAVWLDPVPGKSDSVLQP
jgi:putative transposase